MGQSGSKKKSSSSPKVSDTDVRVSPAADAPQPPSQQSAAQVVRQSQSELPPQPSEAPQPSPAEDLVPRFEGEHAQIEGDESEDPIVEEPAPPVEVEEPVVVVAEETPVVEPIVVEVVEQQDRPPVGEKPKIVAEVEQPPVEQEEPVAAREQGTPQTEGTHQTSPLDTESDYNVIPSDDVHDVMPDEPRQDSHTNSDSSASSYAMVGFTVGFCWSCWSGYAMWWELRNH